MTKNPNTMKNKHVEMLYVDFDEWFEKNYKTLDASEIEKARSIARTAWETAGSIQYAKGYMDGLERIHE